MSSSPATAEVAAPRLLLVDDDTSLLRLLTLRLEANGYEVATATSGEGALEAMAEARPELVITDLRMEGMDGMALFRLLRERHPGLPVLILTAHGSIPEAVEATREGVFGFLGKPFDADELLTEIQRALSLGGERRPEAAEWCSRIRTRSPAMQAVLDRAGQVAATEAGVFIRGASGTGKELLARAIHDASPRSQGPFVAVNTAAMPEGLLESELFGHRKGAFTGAERDHTGLFREADGGTLFLDEVGDMPPGLQVKLLRVLQERRVRPVGGTQDIPVDVRIIAATHRDLEAAVGAGDFREDLFYRLNVVSLTLPPLSERREDIPLLAETFLEELAARYGRELTGFAPEALATLSEAPWPGNVRQLYNVVEQVVALATTPLVPDSLVREALDSAAAPMPTLAEARRAFERDYLERLLTITAGQVRRAAELAGRNRTEFYRLLSRHGLDPARFQE
ncbi:two-component system, NtrC family, response regulator GlrR [Thiohalospira halophila DSM 15071]|uniref:Two-component system, NtrC family, response regulator GlrR n=1 Tax=Thiohalospira halophila DSM 15071 TaxID=1123397 RepID=A0A1I1QMF1_9GAMM|nr:sigma 54-interacting transcriptional regulator [Thiohalospira halophila]SFD23187.1 two-component system, NtrC family, response regulator GlrR [Thiohalospira halophila DSM 15071]